MSEHGLDGTSVLEALAEIGLVEEFLDAVDADDFAVARKLLTRAGLDAATVSEVLRQMMDGAIEE